MNYNEIELSRIRLETIRALVIRHKGEDERSQFKVTPYKLLQYGFIPIQYQDEFKGLFYENKKIATSSAPLTLQELLSYSTYFNLNPEKVCGQMIESSSGAFAVKVKGKRVDVERVINATLNAKKDSLSAQQRIRIALALAKARARTRHRQNQ